MEDGFHTGIVLLLPSNSRARSQSLFRQPVSMWLEVWCAPWKNFNVFDRLLKCSCPYLEFPVCVCTELRLGEKEKENTPCGLYCRVQPDRDQCLLSSGTKVCTIYPAWRLQMAPPGHESHAALGFGKGQSGSRKCTQAISQA